jgi:hypothetical protein
MKNNKPKAAKKEVLPIEKDKKQASEIKREQKDFEKLFEKCVNVGKVSNLKTPKNQSQSDIVRGK